MTGNKRKRIVIAVGLLIVLGTGAYFGTRFVSKLLTWRELDQTYEEQFAPPSEIAPDLKGKRLVFHMKTGLDQDDSQICVGFNIIFAAIEAGADVSILFDAGAILDLHGNLASTSVPVRLQKLIAYQMNLSVDQMPKNYGEYLDLLQRRGAKVYANTAILIVTGDAPQVKQKISGYEFVEPVTYAKVAELLSEADSVIVY
ncbi:hypothetical protein [Gimesia sp.]|uniref:hypothetical protein n=1 Tax=Gimesia sp. TaxID=2024833 RepID=UPI000C521348|nr:hypothetical protein [Gimesia sp.]MAX40145.1 hypothetical protein [Gimesia sp.]HBL46220.1 hypothetical protein [Planctomycetaceae bacterium]